MKKIILLFIPILLLALDSDLDGVPDNIDLCPNTPFLELVNKNGCSKNQLKKRIKYYLSIGYEYDKYKYFKDSKSIFLSISIKKSNLKFYIYNSFLNDGYTKNYKLYTLLISINYYFYKKNIDFKTAIKYYFPTYFNKKGDYAFFIQGTRYFNKSDIGLSEQYKIYGEKNFINKHTITIFYDYYLNKITLSPYIYTENSIYNKNKWFIYKGITIFYSLKNIEYSLDFSKEHNNYFISVSTNIEF